MKVQPFPFDRLKKYSKEEVRLIQNITTVFPAIGKNPPFFEEIEKGLKKYLGSTLSFQYESFFETSYQKFTSGMPDKVALFLVSIASLPDKIWVELDTNLAFMFVDKLLGGSKPAQKMVRTLSFLEEGVLEFLAVKVLKNLKSQFQSVPLKFIRMIAGSHDIPQVNSPEDRVFLITLKVNYENQFGYVRLCFPEALMRDLKWHTELSHLQNISNQYFVEERFKIMENSRILLCGELGNVSLTAEEISQLEVGDIVCLDEFTVCYDGKDLSGTLRMRLGDHAEGYIEGVLSRDVDNKKLQITLDGIL